MKLWQKKKVKVLFFLSCHLLGQKQLPKIQCPPIRNLTNKLGCIHTPEYYAAIEMNGIELWIARKRYLSHSL